MKFSLLMLSVLLFTGVNAQGQSYSFTSSTSPYTNLVGSTSLNGDQTWDDPDFAIPVGFEFTYFEEKFDTISTATFGVGAFLTPSNVDSGIFSLMIPYGPDIIDRGWDFNQDDVTSGSLSTISYLTEGEAGSRILKIEWNNVGFYDEFADDNVSTDFTNFQLWFYEGSNQIEIHFGPNSITQPELSYDEESGPFVAFYSKLDLAEEAVEGEAFALTGNPSSPEVTGINSIDDEFYLDGTIPEGTVYAFSYLISDISDVQLFNQFSVSPNPAYDFFTLALEGDESLQGAQLSILNLSGGTVMKTLYTGQAIDVSSLIPGAYIVQLRFEGRVGVKKLMVH